MKLKWIGSGFSYGAMRDFVMFEAHNVELLFSIHKETELDDDEPGKDYFSVDRVEHKFAKTITATREIEEEVRSVYLIKTDDEFRKSFQHSYYIMKFAVESTTLTIGAYTDTRNTPTAENSYLLCTTDFINLLAKGEKIEKAEQIKNTSFEKLMCLFDKKELAKELLR